ncbi:NAD(P)-dependent alcohol dehydrogenase [Arthrobacter burdickii]|uniref:NAD(P)-dependent alcohol dehydrogenase n=1 Tax=Arthrobacter burdickii TaxID=3035920 RepID=A0ABT8K312_9MICC|nr:NAD(P)-dependent alcohol dehydrogenase [Arthrobacter burdickii]MDN4611562.1 NAD(P)-dependent alcohol dehydrogenase [Arthrobacter burdickii]
MRSSISPAKTTTAMKAVVQHRYGSTEVLSFQDVDKPTVGDGEVLVRIHGASVNHADWVYASGRPLIARLAFGLRTPRNTVRGKDIAGRVEAVGAGVTDFRPGDEVYGEIEAGGFAEFATVPADLLASKPANLTFEQAATVPLSARTALQGLRGGGTIQPGQKVLINGASGGVGTFAIQIAKAFGAEVTGVCSARNAEPVRALGADRVIDYTRENFTESGLQYDLIFDSIGNHPLSALRKALTREGTLVLSSGTGGRVHGPMGRIVRALVLSRFIRQDLRTVPAKPGRESLDMLRDLIESGRVTPVIDRTYPLSQVPEAIDYFVKDHARAKIAITV